MRYRLTQGQLVKWGFIANYGKWATANISNIMPMTMIAQHGNDDYREKDHFLLEEQGGRISRLEEFYFSFVASRTIRAADWFISLECFSVTCVRNTL